MGFLGREIVGGGGGIYKQARNGQVGNWPADDDELEEATLPA